MRPIDAIHETDPDEPLERSVRIRHRGGDGTVLSHATNLFPAWALLGAAAAYAWPTLFEPWKPAIVYLLGLVMFGMGMTLTPAHFTETLKRPTHLGLGLGMQYLLMPLLAWLVGIGLDLSSPLLVGMVLVGASPGGTASNVICYLARGDVALSITLTTLSTLLAVIATPLLTLLFAGHAVAVPAGSMLLDVLKILILPVAGGVAVNHLIGHRLHPIRRVFPLLSVIAIVSIIAIIVALNRPRLALVAVPLIGAVMLHNMLGLALGYVLAKRLGVDTRTARTLAIEVGMQNSGLAVALAVKYFSALSALPGALFSVWHNVSGSLLAAWWSRDDSQDPN